MSDSHQVDAQADHGQQRDMEKGQVPADGALKLGAGPEGTDHDGPAATNHTAPRISAQA